MPDEIKKIPCGDDFIIVKIDKENKMVKVGPYFFETKEDYFYFINKLTDIADKLEKE